MKFSTLFFSAGLIAFAAAATTTSTQPVPTSSYDDATVACLKGCAESDVSCRAVCLGVPTPSEEDANKSTECAAKCPQGSGSPEDTQKYGECQFACYSSYFLPTTVQKQPGGATGTGSATVTGTATGTNGGANPTETSGTNNTEGGNKNDAPAVMIGGTFFGLVAAVAAALAL